MGIYDSFRERFIDFIIENGYIIVEEHDLEYSKDDREECERYFKTFYISGDDGKYTEVGFSICVYDDGDVVDNYILYRKPNRTVRSRRQDCIETFEDFKGEIMNSIELHWEKL